MLALRTVRAEEELVHECGRIARAAGAAEGTLSRDAGRRAHSGPVGDAHVTRARLLVNDAWRRVRRELARVREYPENDVRVVAAEVLASGGADLPGAAPS